MENEELSFKLTASAQGVEEGSSVAVEALRKVGKAHQDAENSAQGAQGATDKLGKTQKEQAGASTTQAAAQKAANEQTAAAATVAASATAAFFVLVGAIRNGITAYNQYVGAMNGLKSVAAGTGESMVKLNKITNDLTADGLMTVSEVAAAEKNLLTYGYTADQTADILDRLKDSAAYSRQSCYTLGEAVKVTTEGIRMENSVLSDAAGVQKNISKMYEEYAKQIGKSSDALTQSEKAQAVYNGIMTETTMQVGNAATYAATFAGQQSALEAQTVKLNQAFGEATSEGLTPFLALVTGIAKPLTEFIENNKVLVAAVTTMVTALVGVVAMLGLKAAALKLLAVLLPTVTGETLTLSGAFSALWAAAGPAGWIVLGIAAVAAVIAGVSAASAEAKKKAEELRTEIEKLSEDNRGAASLIAEFEELSNKTVKTAEDTQRMLDIRNELVTSYGYSASAVDTEGRLLAGNLEIMKEQLETQKKLLLSDMEKNAANDATAYNNALNSRAGILAQIADVQADINDPSRVFGEEWNQSAADSAYREDYQSVIDAWKDTLDSLYKTMEAGNEDVQKATEDMLKTMVMTVEAEGGEVPEAVQTTIMDALNKAFSEGQTYEGAQSIAQGILDSYFAIDEATVQTDIDAVKQLRGTIISALNTEGADSGAVTTLVNDLLNTITDDGTMKAAYDRAAQLKQKIAEGLASESEMIEYDQLRAQITQGLGVAMTQAYNEMQKGTAGAEDVKNALDDMITSYSKSAKVIAQESAAQEAANKTLKDAASSLRSVASTYESVQKSFTEVANMKAAVNAIETYTSATDTSAQAAQNAANARAWLAEQYGVESSAIDGMLPSINDDIALKEALALADYAVGMQAALSAQVQIAAMQTAGSVTAEEAARMINALQGVINKMTELGGKSVTLNGTGGTTTIAPAVSVPTVKKSSGGGGGSSTNKALEKQIELLNHKKALDQLTTDEEIAGLEKALQKYAKTTAEKEKLIEQIYDLKKQKAEEDLAYQKDIDNLTLREEIAALDRMISTFKAGTEARRDLEKQRYEAQRELEQQEYDLKVYYGQLTLDQQAAELQKMISTYKAGTDARIDLEKELYSVQQQIRSRNIDEINTITSAITEALKNKYEEQRDTENERINSSIDAWDKWGNAQTEAIQKQIDALDALSKAEDDSDVEAEKRRKIAILQQAAQYENDAYNKKKILEQLAQAQADLADWQKDKEREALKQSLKDQQDAIDKTVTDEKDKLQKQIDDNNAYYDDLEKESKLNAEAQKILMQTSQENIIALLASYASDYNLTGKTLGEQLVDGFASKVGDISTWFDSLTAKVTSLQNTLAQAADAAASQVYLHGSGTTGGTTNTKNISPTFNLYFTDAAATPAEIKRELQKLIDSMADM